MLLRPPKHVNPFWTATAKQPRGPLELNPSHPLAQNVVYAIVAGIGPVVNVRTRRPVPNTTFSDTQIERDNGAFIYTRDNGTSNPRGISFTNAEACQPFRDMDGSPFSMFARIRQDSASSLSGFTFNQSNSSRFGVYTFSNQFYIGNGASGEGTGHTVTTGQWENLCVSVPLNTSTTAYWDDGSSTESTANQARLDKQASVAYGTLNGYTYNTKSYSRNTSTEVAFVFNKAISQAEYDSLRLDPYALFRPANHYPYLVVEAPVAGATEINCAVGAVTVTGVDASVSQNRNVACDVGTVTVSGVNAVVDQSTVVEISCGVGAITIAGVNASISQSQEKSLGVGALAIAGTNAGIEVNRNVALSTGAVAITGTNAVIDQQVTGQTTVICQVGAVTVSGTAATVNQIKELALDVGSITVSGLAASIGAGQTKSLSVGGLSVVGVNAGIEAAQGLSLGVGIVTVTGFDASIEGLVWTPIPSASTDWTEINSASTIWTEIN